MDKSVQNILSKNAWWWRTTPNETYYREDVNHSFPTNELTSYTLDEIGGSNDIVLLNQYVISLEGQPSTIDGEDTTIGRKGDEEYVFQREYLVLMMPKVMGENFFNNFNSKRKCIKLIEEYDFVDGKIISNYRINDFGKNFIELGSRGIDIIWVTATKNNFGEINYITAVPLDAKNYEQYTFKDKRNIFFNEDNKSPVENFVIIELIRPEVGLNDNPIFVKEFKDKELAGNLNKYLTPKTPNDVSLIEEVITYFQNEVYNCLNIPTNIIKSDGGLKRKSKRSKRRKSKQKSKRSNRRK